MWSQHIFNFAFIFVYLRSCVQQYIDSHVHTNAAADFFRHYSEIPSYLQLIGECDRLAQIVCCPTLLFGCCSWGLKVFLLFLFSPSLFATGSVVRSSLILVLSGNVSLLECTINPLSFIESCVVSRRFSLKVIIVLFSFCDTAGEIKSSMNFYEWLEIEQEWREYAVW